jgi:hypothetical protein
MTTHNDDPYTTLERAAELAESATPGPWFVHERSDTYTISVDEHSTREAICRVQKTMKFRRDADFIASAHPNAVRSWKALVDNLRSAHEFCDVLLAGGSNTSGKWRAMCLKAEAERDAARRELEEAKRERDELIEALRGISIWSKELQASLDFPQAIAMWRGCVSEANAALSRLSATTGSNHNV